MDGRPSEKIAALTKEVMELRAIVDALKSALYASGVNYEDLRPIWSERLTPQQQAMMTMLMAAYPKPVSHWTLLDGLPGHDHAVDRNVKLIAVVVHRCRKVFGYEAIENVSGIGYRLSAAQHASMTRMVNVHRARFELVPDSIAA